MRVKRPLTAAVVVRTAVGLGVVLTVLCCIVAARLPALEPPLRLDGERVMAQVSGEEPTEVLALRSDAGSERFLATDFLEEPDFLPTWEEMDAFFARQTTLYRILESPEVELQRADGTWTKVSVTRRGLLSLPWVFYLQIFAALCTWLAGLITYAYSDRESGASFYAASAMGMAIVIWPAAIYSSRPLALNGDLFDVLSSIDHFGGFIYCTGLVTMFATYPIRLFRGVEWLWVSVPIAMALEETQVLPKGVFDLYNASTGYFLLLLTIAPWQWAKCRRDPVSRAALGWIFLSSLVGMAFFVSTITLPMSLGLPTRSSQAIALSAYALTYAGVSLGVLKLRLFDLDRWWFRTWLWLLSGAFILSIDFLLMGTFELGTRESLFMTLAVAGWLYFPVRQWILGRLTRRAVMDEHVDVSELAAASTVEELEEKFTKALTRNFAPLRVDTHPAPLDHPTLGAYGAELAVPRLGGGRLVCHFRNDGKNLFRPQDVEEARSLWTVCSSLKNAITARNHGQHEERARIRRDLHDDMGASIIRIIHATRDPNVADLGKRAMRDLRNVLMALSPASAGVMEVLEDLRLEVGGVLPSTHDGFSWEVTGSSDWRLTARVRANLVRAFREATTNAIKHGGGDLSYVFQVSTEGLRGTLENTTREEPTTDHAGLGLSNIEARIREIGGEVDVIIQDGMFRLNAFIPKTA